MIVAFSLAPSTDNTDGSVHNAVAAAVKVVRDSGLPNSTSSMFTEIEGVPAFFDKALYLLLAELSPR